MAFPCPYCAYRINIKSAKPGRFRPKCPKCAETFLLTVPDSDDAAPSAQRLPQAAPAAGAQGTQFDPAKTEVAAHGNEPTHATDPFTGQQKPNEDDTQVTGMFEEQSKAGVTDDTTQVTAAFDAVGSAKADDDRVAGRFGKTQLGRKTKKGDDDFALGASGRGAAALDVPETIGGYRVIQELGRGGMGAVYLAQQISLDRPVALKVMNAAWGSDAGFVARFTREAYAAAQLVHHNIVQIYDFGEDHRLHYFSMEFVDGKSLGELVKKKGKLDPEEAVGYTLQAARGLKFAHERGMIHRDIKPDNLMLNTQGVVKVADLGLVKTPGLKEEAPTGTTAKQERSKIAESAASSVTKAGIAMGTPAYMSPEQARDATTVDHRADVYSLGCTLYVLLTGKPPFEGRTVMELFSKHATQPIVPPDALVKRVPKELSALIERMVAKKPDDRCADMGVVVKALEDWLGVKSLSNGADVVTEEHANQLEGCVQRFNAVPLAGMRGLLKLVLFGGSILLALLLLLLGWWKMGLGSLLLAGETILAYALVSACLRPDALTVKIREFLVESRWRQRIQVVVGILLTLVILFVAGLFWHWLGFTLLAVGLAFGLHFGLDRLVESAQQPALNDAEDLFKKLRLRGMDEEALRQFACKYGGNHWEEFFESLFGFDEKLRARDWWIRGQKGQARQKFAAWREPVIRWLDKQLAARHTERDKSQLQQLETKRLLAEGINKSEAATKAEHAASVLVQHAADLRAETHVRPPDGEPLRRPKPIAAIMLQDPVDAPAPRRGPGFGTLAARFINFAFGPSLRFLIGAVLVAGALYWFYQNELHVDAQNLQSLNDLKHVALGQHQDVSTGTWTAAKPAAIAGMTLSFLNGYAPLVAGLLLLLSAFRSSLILAVLMPMIALFLVFGPNLGVPGIGLVSATHVCMAIGSAVGIGALLLTGERR